MKIDVQGAELDVLRGASGLLDAVCEILVECSLVELYAGQPLIGDTIVFAREQGFRVSGVSPPSRAPDGTPLQCDVLFRRVGGERNERRLGVGSRIMTGRAYPPVDCLDSVQIAVDAMGFPCRTAARCGTRLPTQARSQKLRAGLPHGVHAGFDDPARGCLLDVLSETPASERHYRGADRHCLQGRDTPGLLPPGRQQQHACGTQKFSRRSGSTKPAKLRLGSTAANFFTSAASSPTSGNGYWQLRFGLSERQDVLDPFLRAEASNEHDTPSLSKPGHGSRHSADEIGQHRRHDSTRCVAFGYISRYRDPCGYARPMYIASNQEDRAVQNAVREGHFVPVQPATAVIEWARADELVVMQSLHDRYLRADATTTGATESWL